MTKNKQQTIDCVSTTNNYANASSANDYANASTTGFYSHASTTGTESHASTTGSCSHASTTGSYSHAGTAGYDYAHASTTGGRSNSSTTGYAAIACALGVLAKAKAEKGWIIIVDWRLKYEEWVIKKIHSAKVGQKIKGVKIKPNVSYWFECGKLLSDENYRI